MKKIKYLLFIILLTIPLYVRAATILVSENQKPTVGSNFIVGVNIDYGKNNVKTAHYLITYDPVCVSLSELTWSQAQVAYRNEEGKLYIDKEDTTKSWVTGTPFSITFRANQVCTKEIKIEETAPATDDNGDSIRQSFGSITISSVESDTNTQLASLRVVDHKLNSTFDKSVNNYSANVDKDTEKVEIVVKRNNNKQTITSNETVQEDEKYKNTFHIFADLNYGLNKITISVKSESGEINTYIVMVTREEIEQNSADLKRLSVSNTNIELIDNKYTYQAKVPKKIDSVFISAFPVDSKAEIRGTGNKKIIDGENKFEIKVKSSTGEEQVYTINIIRTDDVSTTANTKIKTVKINGEKIEFTNNEYLMGVSDKTTNIKIDVDLEGENAYYKLEGNTEFKEGINTVIINVIDGSESKNYYIRVYKKDTNIVTVKDVNDISKIVINTLVEAEEKDEHLIPKKTLNLLKNTTKSLYYNVLNDNMGLLYQVEINKDVEPDNIMADIEKESDKPLTYKSEIKDKVKILLHLDTEEFSDGEYIRIYSYDDNNNYKLVSNNVAIIDGYVEFVSNGDKHYVFTKDTLIKEEDPTIKLLQQYKDYIIFGVAVLVLIIILLIVAKINKKKKKKVEEFTK